MMRAALLFLAAVGCTTHKNITEAHELAGDEVTLQGQHGHRVTAVGVATPGGIRFYDKANGGMVPANEIVRIEDTSHGLGAVQGLGIGVGIGALTGALIGYSSGDDECSEDSWCILQFTAGEKAVLAGIALGGLGGLVGLVVGAAKGSTTIYEHSSGTSVRVGGPAGSTAGITMTF
jgi:hypothetical protein